MARTVKEIVDSFQESGYKPLPNIPGNRVFVTDMSASTLVWAEDNVIIEHYFLYPNTKVPLHHHPFDNQMIFVSGNMVAYRTLESGGIDPVRLTEEKDKDRLSGIIPAGKSHGFKVGPEGAIIYNIQIWPDAVDNPISAAIEYIGPGMGPIHEELRKLKTA
jgi:hypothetical protein